MSSVWQEQKKYVAVDGKKMAYVERGAGDPIVFLHGNPTSSFLWRNVIPPLEGRGRCLLLDLIGMGDSEKLPDPGPATYTFETHARYLAGFLDAVGVDANVTLVVHDWGSGLGFDWANHHRDKVKAIAYMEALVKPFDDWADWGEAARIFQGFRSDAGEGLILERNLFVERVLPSSIRRALTDDEMSEYRRPFQETQDRWPTLSWPRSIPVAGEPANVASIIKAYSDWLATNELPKLFINAEPGAILVGSQRDFARTWKNQTEVKVPGIHFIQEDSGAEIGEAIATWLPD